jgi:hypothetical protein
VHKKYEVKKEINKKLKSKAEKNWDVDKIKAHKKPEGKEKLRERRNTIIYVVSEKVF